MSAQQIEGTDQDPLTAARHAVLLGDSIFDNAAYVPGGPDVIRQVQKLLPSGDQATLLAVDGHVIADVENQLLRLPSDATDLIVSVGGNDALGHAPLLRRKVNSVGEAVSILGTAQREFAAQYESMLNHVIRLGLPTAVCTIYDTPASEPDQPLIKTALAIFNDIITRASFKRGIPLIDLRLVVNESDDYANPIEPSVKGGQKIAQAIAHLLSGKQLATCSVVFSRPFQFAN